MKLKKMKTAILWIIIVVLSLKVFGDWKDGREREESRKRFYAKSEEIFYRVYYAIEERDDFEALKKEGFKKGQLGEIINKILDHYMVFKDPDFYNLTDEEKNNFVWNMVNVSKLVLEKNNQPRLVASGTEISHDVPG